MQTRSFNRIIGIILIAFLPALALAGDFQRGQELFEHHCQLCHDGTNLAEKESRIKTLSELRQRIAGWAVHSGAEWGKSEIDDVLFYVNKSFYHFKEKAL